MADFRTQMGITINLPGFTLGPFKIKIGIRFDITTAAVTFTQDDGYLVGLVKDNVSATPPLPSAEPNADWAWWAWYPLVPPEQVQLASTAVPATTTILRTLEIDCKSMRKASEVGETMWLVVERTGNVVISEISEYTSTLVRLP